MEPEELERLVLEGPTGLLVERLAPLDKAQRGKLSKTARKINRAYWRRFDEPHPRKEWDQARISLAMLGVCPASSLTDVFGIHDDALVVEVLRHRDREMLDAWLEKTLDSEFPGISWSALRELIRLGACDKPRCDGYVRLMALGYGRVHVDDKHVPLSQRLLSDRELLEDELWRLFEVENHAFAYDWAETSNHVPESYESWRTAVLELSEAGHLDRQRLLTASLKALWVCDNSSVLGGFRKLHEGLKPTPQETAALLDVHAELLSHRVPHVVGFALKRLTAVVRKKAAPADALTSLHEELRPVFSLAQKGHGVKAVKLIKLLLQQGHVAPAQAAEVLMEALLHASSDVQAAAIDVLEASEAQLAEPVRARLAELAEEVSPLVRARVEALAGDALAAAEDAPTDESEDADTLAARLHALPAAVRADFGLEGDPLGPGAELRPLSLDFRSAADLENVPEVEPIADVDTLIDAVAHAIEVVDSGTELERILDGISRLCDRTGGDFEARTEPLLHRLKEGGGEGRGLASWNAPRALPDLVCSWLAGTQYLTPTHQYYSLHGPVRFQQARLRQLTMRITQRVPAPMLAAPTHEGGLIDPRVFVARAHALREAGLAPPEGDMIQGLLRLAWTGRPEALEAAMDLPGNVGAQIRYALGGPEPADGPELSAPLWVAAARARMPDADGPCARTLPLPNAGPLARYTWMPSIKEHAYGGTTYRTPALTIRVEPDFSRKVVRTPGGLLRGLLQKLPRLGRSGEPDNPTDRLDPADLYPTALLLDDFEKSWQQLGQSSEWGVEWTSFTWPLDTNALCARAVRATVARIDMDGASDEPQHAFLKPLFQPGRPWTELAILQLWVSLASKGADLRATAVDLLIAGIEDGRAHAGELHAVLQRLMPPHWLKHNRVAASLGEVGRISPLHAALVAELLERLLGGLDALPRGAHAYLELLHELLSQLRRPVGVAARPLLESVRGSGKAAKLARALCALEGDGGGQRTAQLQAVAVRLERAERAGG